MTKRQCLVKLNDIVRARNYPTFFGYVSYIESIPDSSDYYIEVVFDEDADPMYFYDDELEVLKLIKE